MLTDSKHKIETKLDLITEMVQNLDKNNLDETKDDLWRIERESALLREFIERSLEESYNQAI